MHPLARPHEQTDERIKNTMTPPTSILRVAGGMKLNTVIFLYVFKCQFSDWRSRSNSPKIANTRSAVSSGAHPGIVLCMFCSLQVMKTFVHPIQKVLCNLLSITLQIHHKDTILFSMPTAVCQDLVLEQVCIQAMSAKCSNSSGEVVLVNFSIFTWVQRSKNRQH